MRIFHWAIIVAVVLAASATEEKNRGKRQYFSRRVARPPPYAVQMEPIVQYSQRDPLYNPLASAKSDHDFYQDDSVNNYYGNSEPEPIIEIIIKESNESLPTLPTPTTQAPAKSTKEPIQVFYVKYEKKDQGNGQSRVVYDKPIPALSPHEEHEEIKPENSITSVDKEPDALVTPAPTEPTTTLRAIIRPDSETYHAPSGSGIKVTFGSEKLPPNNHKKRSDREHPTSHPSFLNAFSPAPSSIPKKQHGPPFSLPPNHHRPPAFPQQRIVNSFSSQQQQQQLSHQQKLPPQPNYSTLPQFQSPSPVLNGPRPQRLPITIQGLPEVHQRLQFQSFPPHRISINHPQQPGFPPAISVSHQSVHVQNQPPTLNPSNFERDPVHSHQQTQQQSQHHHHHHLQQQQQQLFKQQQESDKQKYHEQKRQQDIIKQREQQRQAELQRQEQQRQAELQRQEQQRQVELQRQEQQRQVEYQRQQEQQKQAEFQRQEQLYQDRQRYEQLEKQKLKQQQKNRQEQQQQQNFNQQIDFANQQSGLLLPSGLQQHNKHQPFYEQQQKSAEILQSVPKLEQHYAIRENPLHPGPFPPSPKFTPLQYPQNNYSTRQQFSVSHQRQNSVSSSENFSKPSPSPAELSTPKYQDSQLNTQFFGQHFPIPQQFSSLSQAQSIWGQYKPTDNKQKIFATPVPKGESVIVSSTPKYVPSTTQTPPTTTTTTTVAPTTPRNEEKIKENIANLPDEVPDDIREQLLSSGILGNADIQVLDYDKLGDTPIENLPPEALANFYGAGGGAVAASAPVPAVAKKPKINRDSKKTTTTKVEQATLKPGGVEMKVVHFDPNTAQGQAIADQHIREDATHLKPVTVGAEDDSQYNRYLPLKVSGTSFPIPDVPELKDRKISSVVVLAPVDYNFREDDQSRNSKKYGEVMPIRFLTRESLKRVLKNPSEENFKKWLEQESQTEPQKQSVILFDTTSKNQKNGEKEIYMYDVSSQTVTKLSGDLSSAFVDAAESNSETSDSIDDSSFTP